MFTVHISTHFSSAHFLRNYKGKCENLHGHNWKVEVRVLRPDLDSLGMVIDFGELKAMAKAVLQDLDHHNLNDIEYFSEHNPSSEEIARYIYRRLAGQVRQRGCTLKEVRVWETGNSCAVYQEPSEE
jgi:6-pyruvoyltetrahydropterin/6-carboxytetrahydropterin synthase